MDRFKPRTSGSLPAPRVRGLTAGLAACGLAGAVALSGCGAGQVVPDGHPGSRRERHQRPPSARFRCATSTCAPRRSTDYVQPGRDVELLFVAVNGSPDVNDKLVSITSDVGTVSLSGDTSLPANGVLVVGEPDGQIAPAGVGREGRRRQGKACLVQADHQRADIPVHLRLREGRGDHGRGADLRR